MRYFVDIDNTICKTEGNDYRASTPCQTRIDFINSLFDNGHTIIYWTARGSSSGTDWTEFTKQQLTNWGCKYSEIRMGKPNYDLFIDDKSMHPNLFFGDTWYNV